MCVSGERACLHSLIVVSLRVYLDDMADAREEDDEDDEAAAAELKRKKTKSLTISEDIIWPTEDGFSTFIKFCCKRTTSGVTKSKD